MLRYKMIYQQITLQDLAYYLGANWKEGYAPRESVQQYLKHLQKLEEENPYLLLAYVYHLYMGLLSGGQILRRKRTLLQKLKFSRKVILFSFFKFFLNFVVFLLLFLFLFICLQVNLPSSTKYLCTFFFCKL